MSDRIYINNDWLFAKKGDSEKLEIRLPHTNVQTPLNYFDEGIYQFESVYEKTIFADDDWFDKRVFITFEGVAHVANVYVNDVFVEGHKGGYTAFTVELSQHLKFGAQNKITVEVDSKENSNIPPFGNVIDFLTYGGIYREVYLEIKEPRYISDVFVMAKDKKLAFDFEIEGVFSDTTLHYSIRKKGELEWQYLACVNVKAQKESVSYTYEEAETWNLDNPVCYQLKTKLKHGSITIDEKVTTFGFRHVLFQSNGFYLNGEKIKLVGLNRHQSYPYVGYAMPKRPQQLDADILKFELGVNAVRTSHYPQSKHFLDRCDEIGLLVFTEIPGWQHIGDSDWKKVAVQNTIDMVMQNRNHPSIILWGARINESQDDNNLYKNTNRVIHTLDKTRQTGGVRFIKNSNLLEDVYTYNDFSHTGNNAGLEQKSKVTHAKNASYLVSEYNGHMFPTKAFDSESHRLEHAKRHANVLQSLYKHDDITGGFGWCMFDYNTHKDFGSGDKICHHGVMNMFRIPKLASSVYQSQSENCDVLEISSSMDIGEHAGGNIPEIYAFTNADYIKLYKNNEFVRDFHPNKDQFQNMPHPPILIDDLIGELMEKYEKFSYKDAEEIKLVLRAVAKYGQNNLPLKIKFKVLKLSLLEKMTLAEGFRLYSEYIGNWGGKATTYKFEAIKNDKVVKVCEKTATNKVVLKVSPDTTVLCEENGYDVATVRVEITNQNGEILPYYQGVVNFNITGDCEIIGEKSVCAIGGGVATYVKTAHKYGSAKLEITSGSAEAVTVEFQIKEK
ncbi:MAG: glycoside hydrolase family 2 TIM barrel-domain containing protein [Bacillota bacterium]